MDYHWTRTKIIFELELNFMHAVFYVFVSVKGVQPLKIKAQVSSIWAIGGVCFMIVCVLSDLTWIPAAPWWRERVIVYYVSQILDKS